MPGTVARGDQGHALGDLGSRNRPFPLRIPEWMAQSAEVGDHRRLEVRKRRANRSELRLAG